MQENDSSKPVPTVSRVTPDTIIELVYDANKRETGLAVSRFGGLWNVEKELRIETGETLIPYSPHNNLISNRCVLLPSVPVDFGDKGGLLRDIEAFLHRYVDLSPLFERMSYEIGCFTTACAICSRSRPILRWYRARLSPA